MITTGGALSLDDLIPFASTYAAFMGSRSKDQARLNDINCTNLKMVATHGGLSVGEDGPTHQAIDDAGSFLGMFNTMIIEPADANQTDHIIRYVASHYGNFYVRMGRHKVPVITKEDGTIFYDKEYKYEYGKCDLLREGSDITLVTIGSMVSHGLKAVEILKEENSKISVEIIAASSYKKFDENLINSIKKTKKIITVEDHNTFSGIGSQIAKLLQERQVQVDSFKMMGVTEYQLSGKAEQLYEKANLDAKSIVEECKKINL
jgi:transketolase